MAANKGQVALLGALAVGAIVLFLEPWKLKEDPAAVQTVAATAETAGEETPQATEAPEVTEAPEATEGEAVPEEGGEENGDPEASPTPTGPPANLNEIGKDDYMSP